MVGGPNSFAGGRWGEAPVARMLPVEVEPSATDWEPANTAILPVLGGAIHPIWSIVADEAQDRAILAKFPEVSGHNRLGPAKSSAEILARVGSGADSPDGAPALACAVIVKRVDERTRSKTSINELLRN